MQVECKCVVSNNSSQIVNRRSVNASASTTDSLKCHLQSYRIRQQKIVVLHGGGVREWAGLCAYFISSLSLSLCLFHCISINSQTLGSWGVVHAEQMHPPAVALHSPHNEPDATRTYRRRHFHSPQDWGRGRTVPWRCGCRAEGARPLRWANLSALISVSSCRPLLLILLRSSLPLFHSAP